MDGRFAAAGTAAQKRGQNERDGMTITATVLCVAAEERVPHLRVLRRKIRHHGAERGKAAQFAAADGDFAGEVGRNA